LAQVKGLAVVEAQTTPLERSIRNNVEKARIAASMAAEFHGEARGAFDGYSAYMRSR